MNLSDQQIKSILNKTKLEFKNDINLENNIMDEIDQLKGYESLLQQSQNRARVGFYICMILFVSQVISIFYAISTMKNQVMSELETFLPSVFVFIVLIILFILINGVRVSGLKPNK